jgi:hypothetical protein
MVTERSRQLLELSFGAVSAMNFGISSGWMGFMKEKTISSASNYCTEPKILKKSLKNTRNHVVES